MCSSVPSSITFTLHNFWNDFLQVPYIPPTFGDIHRVPETKNSFNKLILSSGLHFTTLKFLWCAYVTKTNIIYCKRAIILLLLLPVSYLIAWQPEFLTQKQNLVRTFSSCHTFSIGFASGLSGGVLHQFMLLVAKNSRALREVCLGSLSCINR